jgi:hypothetical protein
MDQNINNLVEVSIGEIIDKYSILELKTKYINDETKLKNIQYEMNILKNNIKELDKHFFYKLLLFINEKIWLDTDIVKSLSIINKEPNNILLFAEISNGIFENNQKRYRLKNYFNNLNKSEINEYKSYKDNYCFIEIFDIDEIYNKIPEINYICISHDIICIDKLYEDVIKKLFKNPNIIFINGNNHDNITTNYILKNFSIDKNLQEIFSF